MDYETRALPLSYRRWTLTCKLQNMYLYSIWRLGPYDLRPGQSHNSNFDLKNLIKYKIKVVNVSKSQYYEFRHNIMNLGNQNSKYSWRIRDLENPQTGTHFANSVLMYKMCICSPYMWGALAKWAELGVMLYTRNIKAYKKRMGVNL